MYGGVFCVLVMVGGLVGDDVVFVWCWGCDVD